MSPRHVVFLFVQNGLGAAIANVIINGALGWLLVRGFVAFPVWGVPGVASDLAATIFGVSFGTCITVPIATRLDLRRGRLPPLAPTPAVAARLGRLPSGLLKRAFILGGLSLVVLFPPVVLAVALALPGALAFTPHGYIVLKSALAAVQGTLVTPLVAFVALVEGAPRAPVTPRVLSVEGEP